jgi:hydrogenase nickel incorporation protein HypA/HybF
MHEYPITCQLVDLACSTAARLGAVRVRKITLVIGDDAGYVGDSIRLYFDAVAESTICAAADLEIVRVRPQLRCPDCGSLFSRQPFSFACPDCGADGHPTPVGKEFYMKSIEIEAADIAIQEIPMDRPARGNSK